MWLSKYILVLLQIICLVLGQHIREKVNTLKKHNEFRALHNSPPLRFNANLNKVAQDWANRLVISKTIRNRAPNTYGENIYLQIGNKNGAGALATTLWYNERKVYNPADPSNIKASHFTQVVWKATRELGVGIAKSNGVTVVVCNYSPKGNIRNRFRENVLPAKK